MSCVLASTLATSSSLAAALPLRTASKTKSSASSIRRAAMRSVHGSSAAVKSRWSVFAKPAVVRSVLIACVLSRVAVAGQAQTPTQKPTDNYDELFQRYLLEAHSAKAAAPEIQ